VQALNLVYGGEMRAVVSDLGLGPIDVRPKRQVAKLRVVGRFRTAQLFKLAFESTDSRLVPIGMCT